MKLLSDFQVENLRKIPLDNIITTCSQDQWYLLSGYSSGIVTTMDKDHDHHEPASAEDAAFQQPPPEYRDVSILLYICPLYFYTLSWRYQLKKLLAQNSWFFVCFFLPSLTLHVVHYRIINDFHMAQENKRLYNNL